MSKSSGLAGAGRPMHRQRKRMPVKIYQDFDDDGGRENDSASDTETSALMTNRMRRPMGTQKMMKTKKLSVVPEEMEEAENADPRVLVARNRGSESKGAMGQRETQTARKSKQV